MSEVKGKSDDSKDAALRDLIAATRTFLERITPPEAQPRKESWFKGWANTPFVVTVLGGLLLSVTSLSWQAIQAHYARQTAIHEARLQSRMTAMTDFIAQFPAAQTRLYDYMSAYRWLGENATNAVHYSGRNYQQMWQWHEQLRKEYATSRLPESCATLIKTTFTDPEVVKLASILQKEANKLYNATNSAAVDEVNENLSPIYDQLLEAMGREVRFTQNMKSYENKVD